MEYNNKTGWIDTKLFHHYKEMGDYRLTIVEYKTSIWAYISIKNMFTFFVEKWFSKNELQQAKDYLDSAVHSQKLHDEIQLHFERMKGFKENE